MAAPRSRARGQLTRQDQVSLTRTAGRRAKDAIASGGDEDVDQVGTQVLGQHARNLHTRQRHRNADARFHNRELKRLEKKWVREETGLDWDSYKRMKKAGTLPQHWQIPDDVFTHALRRPQRLKRKAVAKTGWQTFKGQGQLDPEQLMTNAARAVNRKLTAPLRRGASAAARRTRRVAGRAIKHGAAQLIPPRLAQSKAWIHTQETIHRMVQAGRMVTTVIGAVASAVTATLPAIGVALGIVIALCSILPSFITGVGAEHERRQQAAQPRCVGGSTPGHAVTAEEVAAFLPNPNGKDISLLLTAEQRATATAIVEEGQKAGIPPRGWAIALMTAMQESTMGANPSTTKPNADGDVGVFQQRALVGWYADGATVEENTNILNDVHYAARTFYLGHDVAVRHGDGAGSVGSHIPGLVNVEGWQSMDLGQAAQTVQVSDFPDYYAKHEATVASLLPTLQTQGCTAITTGSSPVAGVDDYAPVRRDREGLDDWAFYWGECVSYVAFMIRTHSPHTDFHNLWRDGKWSPEEAHFGNAKMWDERAKAVGLRVDQTPTVGAVAQHSRNGYGHVAYITAVHEDGTFDVNEYNHGPRHQFGTRSHVSIPKDFDVVIHFEEPLAS